MELQPIVYVTDMKRAVDWYSTVLDVGPAYQSPAWTALPVGDATLGLHITDIRPTESYLALSLVAKRPLEEVVQRLESAGISIGREIRDEDFGRSLVVIDPDGTAIQINEHRR
jgi:predicted enzyme related to lactoylglutathione lyase